MASAGTFGYLGIQRKGKFAKQVSILLTIIQEAKELWDKMRNFVPKVLVLPFSSLFTFVSKIHSVNNGQEFIPASKH